MGGGGGPGGGGSGGGVVDPPVGALLREMPPAVNASSTPGEVQVNLRVGITAVTVNGTTASLMTYIDEQTGKGSYPGPTIRVHRGDTVKLNLSNGLPPTTQTNLLGYQKNITNLHTHGWHVSPEEPADFVMYHLMPGETYHHVYDTSLQPGGTLNLYHPHIHGTSAEQYWAGLMGALVVEDETPVLAGYETHVLVLKDITLSGTAPAPHAMMQDFMHGKDGAVVMVNGLVNPRLYARPGQVQRWRIVNGSNARVYRLAVEGHTLSLIGTDGGLLDRPYARSEIVMSPGERVDVLVKMTQKSGNFRLRALPYSRMGMMQSPTITLMTVTYSGSKLTQAMPAVIDEEAMRLDPGMLPIAAERQIVLSMGQMNAYINGQDFDVDPYTIMSETGTYEVWTVVNQSGMDHPFHQHVNAAQVLSVMGGDPLYATIPAWKDTVLVPKWGSVTMLVPVMDYTGMAMFHCHILEHEDIGMMGMWHLMEDGGGMPM
jgi:FtsP/CotA-like multicopper oxidase with cupredoxin domain